MNWKEDLSFISEVMMQCQLEAKALSSSTGCDQTACGNSMFIELMMRIRKRGER